MRWVGVGASIVFAVVGCRGNPWFQLDLDDAATTDVAASTVAETTAASTSSAADSASGPGLATSDSGPDATTVGASEAADTTSTGATDTTGATTGDTGTDTSSSGGDTTTGDGEHEIYDLHAMCDGASTDWLSALGADTPDILLCDTSNDPESPPWVGYLPDFMFDEAPEPRVVAAVPTQKSGAQVSGQYNALLLADAVAPHLRAALVCPKADKPCSIIGSVIIELPDNEFVTGQLEIPVGPGQVQDIDIDLTPELATLAQQEFRVVLVVTAQNGDGADLGVWVRPRIVDLN